MKGAKGGRKGYRNKSHQLDVIVRDKINLVAKLQVRGEAPSTGSVPAWLMMSSTDKRSNRPLASTDYCQHLLSRLLYLYLDFSCHARALPLRAVRGSLPQAEGVSSGTLAGGQLRGLRAQTEAHRNNVPTAA